MRHRDLTSTLCNLACVLSAFIYVSSDAEQLLQEHAALCGSLGGAGAELQSTPRFGHTALHIQQGVDSPMRLLMRRLCAAPAESGHAGPA